MGVIRNILSNIFAGTRSNKKEIFPNTSNDIWVVTVFWIWMFGLVAASNIAKFRNAYGAINPVIMFSLGSLGLIVFAFREAETLPQIRRALGFGAPMPGFGILTLVNGIGTGMVLYAVFTGQLLSIANTKLMTSIAQPFYNPYTASATPFLLASVAGTFGILFVNAWVGVFEEIYKVGMYKVTADWIQQNTPLSPAAAMALALVITFALWGAWHFFSWNGLTVYSVAMSLTYGVFFYGAYFMLASAGVIQPVEVGNGEMAAILSGIIIYPAIGAHWSWNSLVAGNGFGIGTGVITAAGASMIIVSSVLMVAVRRAWG